VRGEKIAELCRREGIHQNMYYKWSKEFLEAGKQRLVGDTRREADSQEVEARRSKNEQLKAVVAELTLNNRVLKKSLLGITPFIFMFTRWLRVSTGPRKNTQL
jgi:transposase